MQLARACSQLLDDNADDPDLRRAIFSCVPKNRLAESVSKVNELARPQDALHRQDIWLENSDRWEDPQLRPTPSAP